MHEYRTYTIGDIKAECLVLYAPRHRWEPPKFLLQSVTFPDGAECLNAGDYARLLALPAREDEIEAPESWQAVEAACRQREAESFANTAAMLGLTGALNPLGSLA